MRKIISLIAFATFAAITLAACNKPGKTPDQEAADKAPEVLSIPADPNDKNAWKKYLVGVVTANMQNVKSNHPYMYYVPGGADEANAADRANQLENVSTVVARGVLPGNMMAFGGPDSAITSQLIIDAFKDVQPGSFRDVVVLFIGAPADADKVKQALATSGADARFVEAK